jgi:hypothetical protein
MEDNQGYKRECGETMMKDGIRDQARKPKFSTTSFRCGWGRMLRRRLLAAHRRERVAHRLGGTAVLCRRCDLAARAGSVVTKSNLLVNLTDVVHLLLQSLDLSQHLLSLLLKMNNMIGSYKPG